MVDEAHSVKNPKAERSQAVGLWAERCSCPRARLRGAAYMRPEKSAKLDRLREIVQEAGENGQKTVVFSNFKDVLGVVKEALVAGTVRATPVFGPLTGGVPAQRRQEIVDDFVGVQGPAVLLWQIQAAGVGLNVQAASVVVICEPQIKPTIRTSGGGTGPPYGPGQAGWCPPPPRHRRRGRTHGEDAGNQDAPVRCLCPP